MGSDQVFLDREDVERAGANHLIGRYTSAHLSPFASDQLLYNIDHYGQRPAVQNIFKSTYKFRPEYSIEARQLCMEAAAIFPETAESMVTALFTCRDFQTWWLTSK